MSTGQSVNLQRRTPPELELEARQEYLAGRMSVNGYRIVSELQRRLMSETCSCLRIVTGMAVRIERDPACPFHGGMLST